MPIKYHVENIHCSFATTTNPDPACSIIKDIKPFTPMNRGSGIIKPASLPPKKPVSLAPTTNVKIDIPKQTAVDEMYHLDLKRLGVKENLPPDVKKTSNNTSVFEKPDIVEKEDDQTPIANFDEQMSLDRALKLYGLKKDDDDDDKKKIPVQKPYKLEAGTKELSPEDIRDAKLIRAADIYYKEGYDEAQNYLDGDFEEEFGTRGWKIDKELSENREGIGVIMTKGEGDNIQIRQPFRGTDLGNMNLKDLLTDFKIFPLAIDRMNNAMFSKYHEDGLEQFDEAVKKYNIKPENYVEQIKPLGYSLGGSPAAYVGDERKVPSKTYNPLIGKAQLLSKSEVPHEIIRTAQDIVSAPGAVLSKSAGTPFYKKNYTYKTIDITSKILEKPPKLGSNEANPFLIHDLKQFTQNNSSASDDAKFQAMRDANRTLAEHGNLQVLDEVRTAVEDGLTFTQMITKFNSGGGVDTNANYEGELGSRMHRNSTHAKDWVKAGGKFTEFEEKEFDKLDREAAKKQGKKPMPPPEKGSSSTDPLPPKPPEQISIGTDQQLTPHQEQFFLKKSAQERTEYLKDLKKVVDAKFDRFEGSKQLKDAEGNLIKDERGNIKTESVLPRKTGLTDVLAPTSITTGLVAGGAATAETFALDPDQKINPVIREGITGGLAGAQTVGLASAMGMETAGLATEIPVGAAGFVAAGESDKLISKELDKAGFNKRDTGLISGASSGAIGGLAASATGMAIAAGSAAVSAGEVGAGIGTVGGPPGVALGLGIGASFGFVVGLGGAALGQLFAKPPKAETLESLKQELADLEEQQENFENGILTGSTNMMPNVFGGVFTATDEIDREQIQKAIDDKKQQVELAQKQYDSFVERYTNASKKYVNAIAKKKYTSAEFNKRLDEGMVLPEPKDILSQGELDLVNEVDPTYFADVKTKYTNWYRKTKLENTTLPSPPPGANRDEFYAEYFRTEQPEIMTGGNVYDNTYDYSKKRLQIYNEMKKNEDAIGIFGTTKQIKEGGLKYLNNDQTLEGQGTLPDPDFVYLFRDWYLDTIGMDDDYRNQFDPAARPKEYSIFSDEEIAFMEKTQADGMEAARIRNKERQDAQNQLEHTKVWKDSHKEHFDVALAVKQREKTEEEAELAAVVAANAENTTNTTTASS